MKKIIIVGGGAAGMFAASVLAKTDNEIIILEKNEKLGKKLYITGKGRCNLTNATDVDELIENTKSNPYFMYSSFYTLDSFSLISYFENLGLKTKIERGNRVYPKSEKSSDVIKALTKSFADNVEVRLNTEVLKILTKDNKISGVETKDGIINSDIVILATGGLSYPVTGSTGDGFRFSKELGHKVTKLYPSLVPLKTKESWVIKLQGLSLKNIAIDVKVNNKTVYKDFGEMIFTHFGVSGPVILSASRAVTSEIGERKLFIDLKPALSEKELDSRILKDFEKYINKDFLNALDDLLPKKLISVIIELSKIPERKKINLITKDERKNLVRLLKNLEITITDTTGFNEAVVTMGGVCVDEINASTMESKIIENLYFAGEMIDVDAFTGGFNLQIAFSTANLACVAIMEKEG